MRPRRMGHPEGFRRSKNRQMQMRGFFPFDTLRVRMTTLFVTLEPDAVFADDGKDVEEMREAEELSDAFADFEELQLTACCLG